MEGITNVKLTEDGALDCTVDLGLWSEKVTIRKEDFKLLVMHAQGNYRFPKAFEFYLVRFPHYHVDNVSDEVIPMTEKFTADELQSFVRALREQLSMNRKVALIYTRKSVTIGYIPKVRV